MRHLFPVLFVMLLLFLSGCDSTPVPTISPEVNSSNNYLNTIADLAIADLEASLEEWIEEADIDVEVYRQAQVDTTHQREWIAVWFAEFYGERFGNSKYGNRYLVCYLLYTAPMNHGQNNGSLEFFLSDYWDDYMILLLVDMIEFRYGAEYHYPFDFPQCF